MIDLVDFLWNWSFSLISLFVHHFQVLGKTITMALSSTSPPPASSPLPWKRFAESPLLFSKRSKETPNHKAHHAEEDALSESHPLENYASSRRREFVPEGVPFADDKYPSDNSDQISLPRHQDYATEGDVLMLGGYSMESFQCGEELQTKPMVRMPGMDSLATRMAGEAKVACRKVRKRPAMITIPEALVSSGFGEVDRMDSADKEFMVEGSDYRLAGRRGNRQVMEDGYGIITNINGDAKHAYFGVFDGHGGRAAVDFVSEKLGKNIIAALGELEKEDDHLEPAIMEGYLTTDREFLSQGVGSGTCAATVLLKDGELHVANVGDCRVVMSRKGVANALTSDHRAGREDERTRIENLGGYVNCRNGVWRVQDSLAISRAIGDSHMKEWIISKPETGKLRLTSDCESLIMASDGLWDKVSNQEAVDIVLRNKNSIQSCKELVGISTSRGSRDDITVMIIDLQRFVQEGG